MKKLFAHSRVAAALAAVALPCLLLAFVGVAVGVDRSKLPPAAERSVDFTRDIQPILAKSCFGCHGAEKQKADLRLDRPETALRGGESGPALVPGHSENSLLIHLVAGLVEDKVMPQKGDRLSAEQIGLLRAWINQGAKWADASLVAEDPAKSHWSFRPLRRPDVPVVTRDASRVKNPIDAFIASRLEARGLSLSPEADPVTLIRRLYLVMLGLPPTFEEIQAFAADHRTNAFEQLVDKVLNDPRYGERWGRHWLDVIRFAESNGFETNRERPNAWRFRDYIIDAFNSDKPYDLFIREQIAGDALGVDVATGFLVGGPVDIVGSPDPVLTAQQRADQLDDMVNTTGTAFLGLTLGCARCHTHKFDPVQHTEYYGLTAIFAGVRHGDRAMRAMEDDAPDRKAHLAEIQAEQGRIEAELTQFEPPATPDLGTLKPTNTRRNEESFSPLDARFIRFTILASSGAEPCLDELEVYAGGRNVALASLGTKATASSTLPGYAIHKVEHLNDGQTGNDHSWISNEGGSGWVQLELPAPALIDHLVWSRDRDGRVTDRLVTSYTIEAGLSTNQWKRIVAVPPARSPVNPRLNVDRIAPVAAHRLRFTVEETADHSQPCLDELEVYSGERNVALATNGGRATASGTLPGHAIHQREHINDGRPGNGHSWISNEPDRGWVEIEFPGVVTLDKVVWGRDREEQFADRLPTRYKIEVSDADGPWKTVASSADRQKYEPGKRIQPQIVSSLLPPDEARRAGQLLARRKALEAERQKLTAMPSVYAGNFQQPGPSYRLHRGDPMQKREAVTPATLALFKPVNMPADEPEQQRRVKLAAWISSPDNPLTPRVLVNRLWQYQFGVGLVDTPNDFGRNGAAPTHPELMDWMASELVSRGWSVKALQRMILLSATWRQADAPRAEAQRVDAASRLLWRFPPRRLEAEAIRDSILSVSGTLDLTRGGPSFFLHDVDRENVYHYHPKEDFGPAESRRMVYAFKVRMEQDGIFGSFDCPDGSLIVPRRSISTTPLQALNLFNSHFMLQQADALARRLEREAGPERPAQIRRAWQLACGRDPGAADAADAARFAREHGLPAFCRALLNANEFLFIP